MAQLAAETGAALDHVAVDNHAPTKAGADNRGDGGCNPGSAENREVAPKGSGVAIVEIVDGAAELLFEARPYVEARPVGMHEVGGSARTENSSGAGRSGGVESDGYDVGEGYPGFRRGDGKPVFNLLQTNHWSLPGKRGVLT